MCGVSAPVIFPKNRGTFSVTPSKPSPSPSQHREKPSGPSPEKRTQRSKTSKDGTTIASLKQTLAAGLTSRLFSGSDRAAMPLDKKTTLWRPKEAQKMSSEDIIVVFKPRQAMNLMAIFQHGELGAAIAQYVGGDAGAALSIWPVWTQNLVVCGTQHIEAAKKLTKDFDLKTGADSHSYRGHLKLNGEVCRCVIGVRADDDDDCPQEQGEVARK
ncbi:hypothetical protein V5799_003655 [Amblyomma americanum]|uniref:Uncharacterized protein n=1 Tax=Amblyomma americanum TaxID=6943 RepID=A0AAQ4D8C3_AMBAM